MEIGSGINPQIPAVRTCAVTRRIPPSLLAFGQSQGQAVDMKDAMHSVSVSGLSWGQRRGLIAGDLCFNCDIQSTSRQVFSELEWFVGYQVPPGDARTRPERSLQCVWGEIRDTGGAVAGQGRERTEG